jgi:hypothetical protein
MVTTSLMVYWRTAISIQYILPVNTFVQTRPSDSDMHSYLPAICIS